MSDRYRLTSRHLLTADLLTIQQAPPGVATMVLPPEHHGGPLFLVVASGERLHNGSPDTVGLVGTAEHLGYLAGLGRTRVEQTGQPRRLAEYESGRANGVRSAQTAAEPARRIDGPISQAEYTASVSADVTDRRSDVAGLVAELRKALADGDRPAVLRDWYERMFREGQAEPGSLAVLTAAALLELADG